MTVATMSTACRALFVCFLCALCGAAMATDVSFDAVDVLRQALEMQRAGEKSLDAQKTLLGCAGVLLSSLRETAATVAGAVPAGAVDKDKVRAAGARAKTAWDDAEALLDATHAVIAWAAKAAERADEVAGNASDSSAAMTPRTGPREEARRLWWRVHWRAESQWEMASAASAHTNTLSRAAESAVRRAGSGAHPATAAVAGALKFAEGHLESAVAQSEALISEATDLVADIEAAVRASGVVVGKARSSAPAAGVE